MKKKSSTTYVKRNQFNLVPILIRLPREKQTLISKNARKSGLSVNAYVLALINLGLTSIRCSPADAAPPKKD